MPPNYFCSGCVFCFHGLDCESTMVCCRSQGECLCLVNKCCCAYTLKPKRIGIVAPNITNGERFKVSMLCCNCAIKKPEVICSGASQVCCCVQVYSIPFDKDYLNEPIVGCCCIQCYPKMQICKPYPTDGSVVNKFRGTGTPLPQFMSR